MYANCVNDIYGLYDKQFEESANISDSTGKYDLMPTGMNLLPDFTKTTVPNEQTTLKDSVSWVTRLQNNK